MKTSSWVVMALIGVAGATRGQAAEVHVGLNMRTDLGAHSMRAQLGSRWGSVEGMLVLDPYSAVDGQSDQDVLLAWWLSPDRWALLGGVRSTTYSVIGDTVWHEKLLIGAAARLPSFWIDRFRMIAGVELATELVRHGGAHIATEWFAYESGRHAKDLFNFSLFARAEFASSF